MGFLGFSHITVLNSFAILVFCSDDAQAYRMVAFLIGQGAPVIKWTTFQKKKSSGPKNLKNGFFEFSHITALNRFAILVCCSDHAQTYRMVAYLIAQGAPVIKWTTLWEEKKFWANKTSKKWFFWGFHTLLHQIASQFYFRAPMMLKLTG